ncbi:sister chromatid separation protein [Grosmannia clavigera kw1407]|uniref:Sister chromatid separation protein n=1 Tax=Grosmannia clavigera (strain kw1407 / UAMH 11150) TaxID=655863 RepID=F0XLI7_GROCL|nr:sister chromatid separation protein [Grosmannia clavigera kw1407]EFX01137.1 sister chromatid separation protein [Grosmannia clavigera kw1407]
MSDSESVDYLQPGFDPMTLTNPRLRSILVTYNVPYASNAKKPDLVELFNSHVATQASKILARRARAKRSSMGIIDATQGGQSHSTADGFDDPPPTERKRRTGRAATHSPVKREAMTPRHLDSGHDEDEEDANYRRQRRTSPRKRQSRSTSYQPAAATRTLLRPQSSSRQTRARTPQIKLEPTEEEQPVLPARLEPVPVLSWTPQPARSIARSHHVAQSSTDEEVPFTNDNPFQSGSSPLAAASAAAAGRTPRRRTAVSPEKRSSTGTTMPDSAYARRRTADAAFSASASSSFTLVNPTSPAPESDEDDDDDALEPGEEFTPEAQLELAQEEAALRERNAANGRRVGRKNRADAATSSRRRSVRSALVTPLWVLLLTLLGTYGAWYRQEKMAVGYCGLGRSVVPLLTEQIDWLMDRLPEPMRETVAMVEMPPRLSVLVEPQCELCPAHAFCYSDFSVRCESGYLLKPHPLSLGGLVPLPPTCEPDGERARRVKAVADKAVEELRNRRARWECGDLVDDDGISAASPAMDVPVLKRVIADKRSKKMSKDEFDDLWTAAIGEIETREEVEIEPEYTAPDSGAVSDARLSSTSLARLPFTCAIRRSIRLGFARYRFPVSVLVLAVLALLYVRARFRARRAMLARVPALVDLALERLAAQKELYLIDEDEGGERGVDRDADGLRPDPFLFLPQLRDDVLRSTHSLAARERIWKPVRAVVEQNSNVRAGQREGRNGEVGRAWEWIGPVGTTAHGGVAVVAHRPDPTEGASGSESSGLSEASETVEEIEEIEEIEEARQQRDQIHLLPPETVRMATKRRRCIDDGRSPGRYTELTSRLELSSSTS